MQLAGYTIRKLGVADCAAVQSLFESDPRYFEIVQGAPAAPDEAEILFADLPPGKSQDDKFVYGVFEKEGKIAAILDLVRGYPEPDIWYLGLIFVAPEFRDKRLGSRLIDLLCVYVSGQGGKALRLGVVRTNTRARALYDRLGFRFVVERERAVSPEFPVMVEVMERPL